MKFEISGTVIRIGATKQITEKFAKREFVVAVDEDTKWPQNIGFESTGDRMAALDTVGVGDVVKVEFELRGRDSNKNGETRNWTTLGAWRVDVTKKNSRPASSASTDDIPF